MIGRLTGFPYRRNGKFSFINFGGNTKNVCTLWNGRILIFKKKRELRLALSSL